MRHLYLQPLAVGNIKINYAFQSVSDIIIIGEWDWTKDFICARAGVRTEKTEDNTADILLWDRDGAEGNGYSGKIAIVGHTPVIDPVYLDGKGHTEVIEDRKPQMLPSWGTICMDTGCVFGYRLTGMVIEDGMFYTDSVFWGVDG